MKYVLILNSLLLLSVTGMLSYMVTVRIDLKKMVYEPFDRLNRTFDDKRLKNEVRRYCRSVSVKLSMAEKAEIYLISKSNIRRYIPFFNVHVLVFLCLVIFAAVFQPVYKTLYFIPSTVVICALVSLIPVFALDILGRYNSEKIRRRLADFIAVLNRWCAVKEDIFYAFEKSAGSGIGEPLNTFIREMTIQVKRGIDPVEALELLQLKVDNVQFKDFIVNIKQSVRSAGDIRKLLSNLEAQFYKIEEEYNRRKISMYKDRMAIYAAMFAVLLIGFYFLRHNPDVKEYYLGTLEGKGLFALLSMIYAAGAYLASRIDRFKH